MKKLTKATGIMGFVIISICALVMGLTESTAQAYSGIEELS